ncbi:MAG: 4Fe-4S dicluster domain-containing protein [Spirochaetes bacterium]|jgi:molybdopterin-containing oxidoreductase family iron-sulfur binding subunit|nr:4Fe-4S dicluster domain-containing protein [Spirochaetota bacterium]
MMKDMENKMKRRWGMAIDLDKCTGCGECAVSCAQENNLPIFEDDSDIPKKMTYLDVMRITNDRDAKFPDVKVAFIPKMCQQCEGNDPKNPQPPCVSVCPVVATDTGDDGVVSQIWSRCIGCRYCQVSCPYEARVFNWWKPKYEGSFKKSLNPDVSIASRGTIQKCTFCSHIWKKERDKAVMKGELDINAVLYTPACVSACPTGAMVFGDLNDPKSEVSRLARDNRAFRLVHTIDQKKPDEQKKFRAIKNFPNPKVYYLSSKQWIRDLMRFK